MWWYYFQDLCLAVGSICYLPRSLLDTRSCKEVEDRHRRTLVLLSGLQSGLVCMPFPFHRRSRESRAKGEGEGEERERCQINGSAYWETQGETRSSGKQPEAVPLVTRDESVSRR